MTRDNERDNEHGKERGKERFEELILCLQWILYAERPLKPEELYYAILSGIEEEAPMPWSPEIVTANDIEKFILGCSKGLAETTKSKSQTVQFIHESVRDFLLGKHGINKLRFGLDPGQSHERLRHCCYLYMQIDVSADVPLNIDLPKASMAETNDLCTRVSTKLPFLEYSVHNVLIHANDAGKHGIPQGAFLRSFIIDKWIFLNNMLERYRARRHTSSGEVPELLLFLIQKDLVSLVREYRRSSDNNALFCNQSLLTVSPRDWKVSKDMARALLLPAGRSEGFRIAIETIIEL